MLALAIRAAGGADSETPSTKGARLTSHAQESSRGGRACAHTRTALARLARSRLVTVGHWTPVKPSWEAILYGRPQARDGWHPREGEGGTAQRALFMHRRRERRRCLTRSGDATRGAEISRQRHASAALKGSGGHVEAAQVMDMRDAWGCWVVVVMQTIWEAYTRFRVQPNECAGRESRPDAEGA